MMPAIRLAEFHAHIAAVCHSAAAVAFLSREGARQLKALPYCFGDVVLPRPSRHLFQVLLRSDIFRRFAREFWHYFGQNS